MLSFHDHNDKSGDTQVGLYGNIHNVVTQLGDRDRLITHFAGGEYYLPTNYKFYLNSDVIEWLERPAHIYIKERFDRQLYVAARNYNTHLSVMRERDHKNVTTIYMREHAHIRIDMNRDHAMLFKLEFL